MDSQNRISQILYFIGVLEIIVGSILAFYLARIEAFGSYSSYTEFSFSTFMLYLGISIVTVMLIIGFSEVVDLLSKIVTSISRWDNEVSK